MQTRPCSGGPSCSPGHGSLYRVPRHRLTGAKSPFPPRTPTLVALRRPRHGSRPTGAPRTTRTTDRTSGPPFDAATPPPQATAHQRCDLAPSLRNHPGPCRSPHDSAESCRIAAPRSRIHQGRAPARPTPIPLSTPFPACGSTPLSSNRVHSVRTRVRSSFPAQAPPHKPLTPRYKPSRETEMPPSAYGRRLRHADHFPQSAAQGELGPTFRHEPPPESATSQQCAEARPPPRRKTKGRVLGEAPSRYGMKVLVDDLRGRSATAPQKNRGRPWRRPAR